MKLKPLKLSTLCLMIMGGYQGVAADTQVQLLPLFKAAEIPSLCDASLASMQKDIQIFENKKIKDELNYKEAESLAELQTLVMNYMNHYNNTRRQWTLKKMTPDEYRSHLIAP